VHALILLAFVRDGTYLIVFYFAVPPDYVAPVLQISLFVLRWSHFTAGDFANTSCVGVATGRYLDLVLLFRR